VAETDCPVPGILAVPAIRRAVDDGRLVIGPDAGPEWHLIDPEPPAVHRAREATRKVLAGEPAELIDDVELIVSELATNAVNHAVSAGPPARGVAPGIWLGVQVASGYVRVYVRDPYPAPPVQRVPDEDDESGRGLLIVEALADRHSVHAGTYDKTIVAVVVRPGVEMTDEALARLVAP
jgi:anti-sigma regulatory factor (Ser/Thr protein kinase)